MCQCAHHQANQAEHAAVQLRRNKRDFQRLVKGVRAALTQAEEDMAMEGATTDQERAEITVEALDGLRAKLQFLAE